MVRVTETKLVEVHGNDGTSYLTFAKNWVKRYVGEESPDVEIVGARFAGQRCEHGNLMVEVTFTYDAAD